jgi:hypothetical protein
VEVGGVGVAVEVRLVRLYHFERLCSFFSFEGVGVALEVELRPYLPPDDGHDIVWGMLETLWYYSCYRLYFFFSFEGVGDGVGSWGSVRFYPPDDMHDVVWVMLETLWHYPCYRLYFSLASNVYGWLWRLGSVFTLLICMMMATFVR